MAARSKSNSIEKIFEKHNLSVELIARFGIVDGSSCLRALHTLNACGYLISTVLRSTVKDCLKFYSVDKGFLKKYVQFYINDCSPHLKSAFVLFPIFLQRVPEAILTINELQNAVKWINDGILTGDSISSVVSRCCSSIIEQAVHLQCTNQLTEDCFLSDNYTIRKHWINALNKFGGQVKRKCFAEIKNGDLNALTDNQLIEYLLTNSGDSIDCQKDNDAEENDGDFSDSDFGEDEEICEEAKKNIDNLCDDFSSQLNLLTEFREVYTMADVIKRASYQSLELTDNGFEINQMPRNTIRKFYKFMKELIRKESQFNDVEHFKRLLIIQLSTHSIKIISFCQLHLDNYAKRLKAGEFDDVHQFFWSYFLKTPQMFRPLAVSAAIQVLFSRTKMNIIDVTTKLCDLTKETRSKSIINGCDIILCAVLEKNYTCDVDYRSVYKILLDNSCFNWYKTWKSIFDGIFKGVHCPLPVSYFNYCDNELLTNATNQLKVVVHNKMSLMNRLNILQFSFLLLERFLFIGPLGFEEDLWPKSEIKEIVTLLKRIRLEFCPVYSFMRRMDDICLRFENVI